MNLRFLQVEQVKEDRESLNDGELHYGKGSDISRKDSITD